MFDIYPIETHQMLKIASKIGSRKKVGEVTIKSIIMLIVNSKHILILCAQLVNTIILNSAHVPLWRHFAHSSNEVSNCSLALSSGSTPVVKKHFSFFIITENVHQTQTRNLKSIITLICIQVNTIHLAFFPLNWLHCDWIKNDFIVNHENNDNPRRRNISFKFEYCEHQSKFFIK